LTRKTSCYGPAPEIRGRVHSYWLQQKKIRLEKQAASGKRQAASNKDLDKPIDLWEKVI
jgi:hypothetical protein